MPGVSHRPEAAGDPTDEVAQAEPIHLSHEDIGAIAAAVAPAVAQAVTERVLELLDERQANDIVDAADLARMLGVDRGWVYEHADQLGAIRLGEA
jgi:formaldehyde-activating enzyme involved in methanogenesis